MHPTPSGRPSPSGPPNVPRTVTGRPRRFRRVRRWYRSTPQGQAIATLVGIGFVLVVVVAGLVLVLVR